MPTARPALSASDRLAVVTVAHAAVRPTEPIEHFQARRLTHARRSRATWWLLEDQGEPVASLLCYPLDVSLEGRRVQGYGIGAVATRPEARRRGFATSLCRSVVEASEKAGRPVGLLFSEIAPSFYERLGFRASPAWHHVAERLDPLVGSGLRLPLRPLDARRESVLLADLYERHHGAGPHLHRDATLFEKSVDLNPADLFFGVGEPLRGYVRLAIEKPSVDVVELVLPEGDRPLALRAVADLAMRLGHGLVEGWFDPCPPLEPFFVDRGRATTLPMLRGVEDVSEARFWGSDYF